MGKTWSRRTKDNKARKKQYEEYEPVPYKEFRACTRKRGSYASARVAQMAADEQMEQYDNFLRPYKCPFCKQYHLTHHPYPQKEEQE